MTRGSTTIVRNGCVVHHRAAVLLVPPQDGPCCRPHVLAHVLMRPWSHHASARDAGALLRRAGPQGSSGRVRRAGWGRHGRLWRHVPAAVRRRCGLAVDVAVAVSLLSVGGGVVFVFPVAIAVVVAVCAPKLQRRPHGVRARSLRNGGHDGGEAPCRPATQAFRIGW